MAVTVEASTTYESGASGYVQTHTFSDLDLSLLTDPYFIACGAPRDNTWIDSWTIEAVNPTAIVSNISGDSTAGIDVRGRIESGSAATNVIGTSSFKLMAGIAASLSNVDQTTPIAGTSTADGYSAAPSITYSGTRYNKLLIFIATKEDKTFTASNCTLVAQVSHADANLGSVFLGEVDATGGSQSIGATFTGDDNWRAALVEVATIPGLTGVILC